MPVEKMKKKNISKNVQVIDLEKEPNDETEEVMVVEEIKYGEDHNQDNFEQQLDHYILPVEIQTKLSEEKQHIEQNQSLSSRFRSELEEYLTTLETKSSEIDGEKLIKFPKNFQTIVNAMTREDLYDNTEDFEFERHENLPRKKEKKNQTASHHHPASEKPPLPPQKVSSNPSLPHEDYQQLKKQNKQAWYRYLMEDYINQDLNQEHEGRYASVLLENTSRQEEQVKKGLAEILLLDRELYQLSKKAEMIFPDSTPRPQYSRGSTGSSPMIAMTPGGFMTPGSASSRQGYDRTFLTKDRDRMSRSYSNTTTPRSPLGTGKQENTGMDDFVEEEEDYGKDELRDKGSSDPIHSHLTTGKKRLTAEQEQRIEQLLSLADNEEEFLSQFAYISTEDKQRDQEITTALAKYGHLDRLEEAPQENAKSSTTATMTVSEGKKKKIVTKIMGKEDSNDYLRQQREERKEREYAQRIDQLIHQLRENKEVDYRHFFTNSSEKTVGDVSILDCRSRYSLSLHEIPSIKDLRMDVPITREDIQLLLAQIRRDIGLSNPTSAQSSPRCYDASSLPSTPGVSDRPLSSHSMTEKSSVQLQLAPREEIQQLLSSLEKEKQRFELYRHKFESTIAASRNPIPPARHPDILTNQDTTTGTNTTLHETESPDFEEVGVDEVESRQPIPQTREDLAQERPFSPSDFQLLPDYVRLQPPLLPPDETKKNDMETYSTSISFPPIRSQENEERGNRSRSSHDSINPYSIHRRVHRPTSSSSTPLSPRAQRQNLSSRGEDPDAYGMEVREDDVVSEEGVKNNSESENDEQFDSKPSSRSKSLVERVRQFVEI